MADNIYLLETRLSRGQRAALEQIREVARAEGLTVFLVGGAVRDLISGTAVRDLDVAVQGDARKLRKPLQEGGAIISGESDFWQSLFLSFPGGIRMEVGSTLAVTYPKPGKPVVTPATILEDLRRRDFTANAMALSLNEGSYGLLMDPLNGVADMENRQLRLVSNYGFIESPVLLLRAARFMGRLGWTLEEKTQARYDSSKEEDYIAALDGYHRGYETEELFHEEDALRVMRRLEEEGWLKHLSPALSPAKANAAEIGRLQDQVAQLQVQGIMPDPAAISFPLITAKLSAGEVQGLKKSFPRQGFVREIESIEAAGKEFVAQLAGKAAALPSQAYKMLRDAAPELVLWAAFSSKNAGVLAKFKSFSAEWPQARQRIPYTLMQEMRITPDLPSYDGLVEQIFYELMDGKLESTEAMKAFLEPFSPPAPPPPVSLRRPRVSKKESKPSRSRKKTQAAAPEQDDAGASELEQMTDKPENAAAELEGTAAEPKSVAPAPPKPEPVATVVEREDAAEVAGPGATTTSAPSARGLGKTAPVVSEKSSGAAKAVGTGTAAKVSAITKPAKKPVPERHTKSSAAKSIGKSAAPAKTPPGAAQAKTPPGKTAAATQVGSKAKSGAKRAVAGKGAASGKSALGKSQPQKGMKAVAKKATPVTAKKTASKAPKPAPKKVVATKAAKPPAKVAAKGRR